MKQKYLISKDNKNKTLTIQEFAELDKEIFSLLCEETYPDAHVQAAIEQGNLALIAALRTPNMFPIGRYATRIAEEVIDLYQSKEADAKELFFDDIDILVQDRNAPEDLDENEDDLVEIDDLLDDDSSDSDSDFDDEIKDITQPIQIADDDDADTLDDD